MIANCAKGNLFMNTSIIKCIPSATRPCKVSQRSFMLTSKLLRPPASQESIAKKKLYEQPPSYKQQIKKGVPFGKRKIHGTTGQLVIQGTLGLSLCLAFIASPFLGQKIAKDDAFREKYVPEWYDCTVKKQKDALPREEYYDRMIDYSIDLHKRAIKGEFAADKLKKRDWEAEGKRNKDSHEDWAKIHPFDDEEDDDEDEDDE
mmetsp:Transcript_28970/g.33349  ORF Transcript_28970/g.33349 Transcript_28970/m.33349 type:complete len:203 (+) Transcript_28970:134-742(+)|eukprot:CAMPEP_0194377870 /NCGR_PEP_ID=MMETSP0174-20130528/32762_1 /TAXON_ID=216777 /ORGANISM="Proboscia alata, Strain PI-D3" /LENGTH=202 /DNA_ID=CAMNT_0039159503 /DNA_START=130 /DNA_END=738 /DNA_ORIENTATION=+